jgi:hypothetical protein
MLKIVIIVLSVLVTFSCTKTKLIESASMFGLISHPEQYDGKKVQVIGFLHKSSDIGYYLYPYEEDVKLDDLRRRILLDGNLRETVAEYIDFQKCANFYVKVEGVFYLDNVVNAGIISDTEFVMRRDDAATGGWQPCYIKNK